MRHFFVWCPELGEEESDATAVSVERGGPREAACEWAENRDRNTVEYSIAKGEESPDVLVREKETGELTAWHVYGEAVPQYYGQSMKVPNEHS